MKLSGIASSSLGIIFFASNLQVKEVLRLQNASASNLLITIALAGTEESNFNKFGSGRLKIEMKSSTQ